MIRKIVRLLRSTYRSVQKTDYLAALEARREIERLKAEHATRLLAHGFQAFSQNDEDGMVQEIFRRMGAESRTFAEIGSGDGLENNTLYLLLAGWSGLWVDADAGSVQLCRERHRKAIESGVLQVEQRSISAENIEQVLRGREALDLLSMDIDGNDYWVWKALERSRPRAVVIEYNATFRPPVRWVQDYRPGSLWNGTNAYGASLAALEELGAAKGYALVGCDLSGNNAFFVRQDCLGGRFEGPFTAEAQYMSPRYDLFAMVKEPGRLIWNVHPPGVGDY